MSVTPIAKAQGLVDTQDVEGMRADANVEEILASIGHHVPEGAGRSLAGAKRLCWDVKTSCSEIGGLQVQNYIPGLRSICIVTWNQQPNPHQAS